MQGRQVTQRRTRAKSLRGAGIAVCLLVGLSLSAPHAHAAFPGRNGVIAFAFDDEMLGMFPGSRRITTLIPQSRRLGEPVSASFSPGGRVLAFGYQGDPDIYIKSVSRRGRARRMIHKPPGTNFHVSEHGEQTDDLPAWSPDGKSIVFMRLTDGPTPTGGRNLTSEIRIYHAGHSRLLVRDAEFPAWSSRNEIAFSRGEESTSTLHVIRPDGSGERKVASGSFPDWSPDGRRLAFEARGGIRTISRTGTGLRRVTKRNRRCSDGFPKYSPGGGQIAFSRDAIGEPCRAAGLVVVRKDGRHLRRLRRWEDFAALNDWQPLPRR